MDSKEKIRAPRNRTITLTDAEREKYRRIVLTKKNINKKALIDEIINADFNNCLDIIEDNSVDLLILDPPYNLDKNFNGFKFSARSFDAYTEYLKKIFSSLKPKLKQNSTIYICGDWKTSVSIFDAAASFFQVRNRITWEREKGRGALTNWKNCSEDIWFCTVSDDYIFNLNEVMMRRKVIAPYKDAKGNPKDWTQSSAGNFRDTSPSNFWSDITIPFWSMPENTDHPTQKSEKLIAKLVLASSVKGGLVLDPFLGSGTTAVVAKKLDRRYLGFDINEEYCLLAAKRLEMAAEDRTIQGYSGGVFWERNSLNLQRDSQTEVEKLSPFPITAERSLFD
jgi:site-specific DNA-methyltransferase (adenine-specific)